MRWHITKCVHKSRTHRASLSTRVHPCEPLTQTLMQTIKNTHTQNAILHTGHLHAAHTANTRCPGERVGREFCLSEKKEGENKETTHYWTPPSSDPVKEWEAEWGQASEKERTEKPKHGEQSL